MMDDDPIRWFRLYAEAIDDEKLRLLSFEDRWHFVALLCCKAQGLINPADPLMRRKLAVKMGLDPRELENVTRRIAEVGLVDRETMEPLAWSKRQYRADHDPTNAERQRRFRDRRRAPGDVDNPPQASTDAPSEPSPAAVLGAENERNGRVTDVSRLPETETETETETESAKEVGATTSSVAPKRRRSAAAGAAATRRCPDDFAISDEMRAWAARETPGVDLERETAKMRDHEFARARSDWPATWRNWLRQAAEIRPPATAARGGAPPGTSRQADLERRNAEVAARWRPPELREGGQ